ncbi:nascent polypeptide-associated complex subunit alpha, muscle-specific form-like [Corythoichthys intestinalis]|uniref:nascent polypeptide-associated complex subunit alpha, muscle-specific form-like n=1 Tax=Corythoichthys intestinalis TaxID=161448 RepID=UPI0025A4F24E|nr:nascent polypeptide-associated complex subunit alpha, muscle-specific form-like [Corythoichthys intestinalis]
MAPIERGGSRIFNYLGLFLLAAHFFCQCSKAARLKTADSPSNPDESRLLYNGRLLVFWKNQDASDVLDVQDSDYQADMGWDVYRETLMQDEPFSKSGQTVTDQLIKMDPKVECTADSMKLVASAPGSLIFVDRGSLSPLPLSMLPLSCGYSVGSTSSNILLVAPYNGCFVTHEEDSYVLALLWWGLAVKMTCPLSASPSNPPMVTCHPEGMLVKTKWTTPLSDIKINVTGQWELLTALLPKCAISIVEDDEGVLIDVRYGPCVDKKDGMYTFELAGGEAIQVSCPSVVKGLPEPTNGQTMTQTESPKRWLYPSHPLYNLPSNPGKPAVPHKPVPARNPSQNPGLPENKPHNPAPEPLDNKLPSYLFPNPIGSPATEPVKKPTPEALPGKLHEPYYPPAEKPNKDVKILSPENPPKMPEPEDASVVPKKPYYPFLPNPWPNNPSKELKAVLPTKLTQPDVLGEPSDPLNSKNKPSKDTEAAPSDHLNKPDYPFLPNLHPGKKQTTPKENPYYPVRPDAKPTKSPKLIYPQNPEATTVGTGEELDPYLFPFPPDPENESEAEKPPGKIHQPGNSFPSKPLFGFGLDPNDKPMLAPKRPEEQPTYPRYPKEPGKRPIRKPEIAPGPTKQPPVSSPNNHMRNPKNPEVTPGKVKLPPNPFHYPLDPKEPTKNPMQVTPGEVDDSLEPHHYPPYPVPGLGAPNGKPKPNPNKGKQSSNLDPYPLYPNPEATRKPETDLEKHEATLEEVDELTDPETYGFYPKPNPQGPTKTPQEPEATPGQVNEVTDHDPYPLFPMPSPKETTKNPMSNPKKPEVEQPTDPYSNPLYPMPKPKEPAKKPMPELWPFKPEMPIVPPGPFKQPTDPYNYPPYPKPNPKESAKKIPNRWLYKPKRPEVASGAMKPPQHPFPLYPRPSPKEPAKKPLLLKPHEPETQPFNVKQPVAKPALLPELPSRPSKGGKPPHNPYVVYPKPGSEELPMPSLEELTKEPLIFPQTPDLEQPEVSGHVRQQTSQISPFNVVKNPPKSHLPGNVYQPLEHQKPDGETPGVKWLPEKPKGEKPSPIRPLEEAKKPATKPLQSTNSAVVPPGTKLACSELCPDGFPNCCPQISFHQHLYLSSAEEPDKLTHVMSRELPFVASVAYYRPGKGVGYSLSAKIMDEVATYPEKAADSVPDKKPPSHQTEGGDSLQFPESYSNTVPASEAQSDLHLAKSNFQDSKRSNENGPDLPRSRLSPQVLPYVVQNPYRKAQNGHPKKQNSNLLASPHGFLLGSDKQFGPSHMLNDAEAAKNTSFLWNLPYRNRAKESLHDQIGHSSEPKRYVLLHRGPPGKEPKGLAESKDFRVDVYDQAVPVRHHARLRHDGAWYRKPRLADGLSESSKTYFKPRTNLSYFPGSKEQSWPAGRQGLGHHGEEEVTR